MNARHFVRYLMLLGLAAALPLASQKEVRAQGFYYPHTMHTHHASTIGEGYARGMADIVRSAGVANLMHSQAALNYEDARAKYFDNRLRGTQTYFEMRQLNKEHRAQLEGQRVTSEQLFRIAKQRAPATLGPAELDPYSGEIRWPAILLDVNYAADRTAVQELVSRRISDPLATSAEDRIALRAALDSLAAQMQANISAYAPQDYVAAKSFLQSLAVTTGAGPL